MLPKPPSSTSDLVAVPICKQEFLSLHCNLEAGHEGFHRDDTTRYLVRAHWPPKKPPESEIKRDGGTRFIRNR
jgi:hypothetical protein